ncbi:TPA: hypothetical protein GXZ54_01175 [bacterium]|nr:hypothetical protein [bacterium]
MHLKQNKIVIREPVSTLIFSSLNLLFNSSYINFACLGRAASINEGQFPIFTPIASGI